MLKIVLRFIWRRIACPVEVRYKLALATYCSQKILTYTQNQNGNFIFCETATKEDPAEI